MSQTATAMHGSLHVFVDESWIPADKFCLIQYFGCLTTCTLPVEPVVSGLMRSDCVWTIWNLVKGYIYEMTDELGAMGK